MESTGLGELGKQCEALAKSVPTREAPFGVREGWWKEVRALYVGPLTIENVTDEIVVTPAERSALRDALRQIDTGKNIKNSEPDPGSCVQGLETFGQLLAAFAARKSLRERAAESAKSQVNRLTLRELVRALTPGELWALLLGVAVVLGAAYSLGYWVRGLREVVQLERDNQRLREELTAARRLPPALPAASPRGE